jgi:hypothetical protein
MTPDSLADLYLTHSGPPPRAALCAALLGGSGRRDRLRTQAALRMAARLAADTRQGIARRRPACPKPEADRWLARLVADLALHRAAAVKCFRP